MVFSLGLRGTATGEKPDRISTTTFSTSSFLIRRRRSERQHHDLQCERPVLSFPFSADSSPERMLCAPLSLLFIVSRIRYSDPTGQSVYHYADAMAYAYSANRTVENLTTQAGSNLEDTNVDPLSSLALVIRGLIMTVIIVGAIFGNLLVISSVLKFERLRVITNYFVVSLATADLLVAIVVMPFNASAEITGKWVFGRTICDIFIANDVLFSTASILHLCCISMDRYIAIIHPLQYERKMTRKRTSIMLFTTWISSILISYIPVYTELYSTEEHMQTLIDDPDSCQFIVNKVYAGVSSSVSFWIPCTIMVFVYARVFIEARKQEKMIQSTALYSQYCNSRLSDGVGAGQVGGGPGASPEKDAQKSVRRRMKREHKAAKTLGIIMGAFILCFLPFFSWYVSTTMCGESCPYPSIVGSTLFWIGYFNSCLNPIIYAYFNREFRTAFKKLLRLDRILCESNSCDYSNRPSNAAFVENTRSRQNKEPCNLVVRLSDSCITR